MQKKRRLYVDTFETLTLRKTYSFGLIEEYRHDKVIAWFSEIGDKRDFHCKLSFAISGERRTV